MTYAEWMSWCDRLFALEAEGRMTEDVDYDWRAAYEWGETPRDAVHGAVLFEQSFEQE